MSEKQIGVLFVCIGNICRSPTAEGIFQKLASEAGHFENFHVDSAGMSNYHIGSPAHSTSRKAAEKRGYELLSRARQFETNDFDQFDYILPMDESNYVPMERMARSESDMQKIVRFISLCKSFNKEYADVPDPYYGGREDFDHVIDVCEEGCKELFDTIVQKHFSS